MNRKVTLCLPILLFTAACGGTSGGISDETPSRTHNEMPTESPDVTSGEIPSGPTETTTINTLWKSPTGGGAGLIRLSSLDGNLIALVEDVDTERTIQGYEIVEVTSKSLNADGSVSSEVVLELENGQKADATGIFYESSALYAGIGETSAFVVGGERASNLPAGTYSYSGYAESFYVYDGFGYSDVGDFEMEVRFTDRSIKLVANAAESRYINESLKFNQNGEIHGGEGAFIVYSSDGESELERRSIDFDGTFHGLGATNVSGIAVGGSVASDDFSLMALVGQR